MKAILIGMVMVLLVFVGVGFGDPMCGAIVKHPEYDGDLGITSEQRQDLENLFEKTEKEIIESTGTIRVKQLEMDRLMRSDAPDIRDVRKLVNEIGDARSAVVLAGIERDIKMREILGPERMRAARKMVMRMGEGRQMRFGQRGMRDRGIPGMNRAPRCGRMGMRGGEAGMPGMGCHEGMMQGRGEAGMPGMGCHEGMMQGRGEAGMPGMGCHEGMMQGAEPGMPGMGCHKGMMQGAEPGMPGMGCHKGMMQGAEPGAGCHKGMMQGDEKPGKQEKACPHHQMKEESGAAPGKSSDSQDD